MTHRRFYVSRDSIRDGVAVLPPGQAHHLRNVLRIGSGEIVEIYDGEGNGYIGEVRLSGASVLVEKVRAFHSEAPAGCRLVLAASLIKSAKYEWILQKATELGVDEIVPLKTHLSDIRIPDDKIDLRLVRWERIVREASKQCRRFSEPHMHAPVNFSDFLQREESSTCLKLLFYEKTAELWRFDKAMPLDRVVLCTGPEGGWDRNEIELARKSGFQIASLGPWILRAETAALAALSIVQYEINLRKETV